MLEKNDLIQLKARTLERLQEVNVEDYALDQTDVRLKDYVKSAISHPDDHNLYELLSILRFVCWTRIFSNQQRSRSLSYSTRI